MKNMCEYHPDKPAHWWCSTCNLYCCPSCINKYDDGGISQNATQYLCPKCRLEAEWVGAENALVPFWQRMHRFFTYPFTMGTMGLIILLALLELCQGIPVLGFFLGILIWGVQFKYAFAALRNTGMGDLAPPELSSHTLMDDFSQVFRHLLIYLVIGLSIFFVSTKVSPVLGVVLVGLSPIVIPAMIMIFVATDNLVHAVNPVIFLKVIFRIGWSYLLMFLFLFMLGSAPVAITKYVAGMLPDWLYVIILSMVKFYYMIVSYHLMGYVLLQYNREIGYKVDFESFHDPSMEAAAMPADPQQNLLDQLSTLIKDGNLDQALAQIREETGGNITNGEIADKYYTLLKMKKQTKEQVSFGKKFMEILFKKGDKQKAFSVFRECLKIDPAFLPEDRELFKTAEYLNETGKYKQAVQVFGKVIKKYPGNTNMLVKAYFRTAQILNDRLMNPEKSKRILLALMKKYPDHDMIPQIKNYLSIL